MVQNILTPLFSSGQWNYTHSDDSDGLSHNAVSPPHGESDIQFFPLTFEVALGEEICISYL